MSSDEITRDAIDREIEAMIEEGLIIEDEDGGLWLSGALAGEMRRGGLN